MTIASWAGSRFRISLYRSLAFPDTRSTQTHRTSTFWFVDITVWLDRSSVLWWTSQYFSSV